MERPLFTVTQLNEALKNTIEANLLFSNVCVMGEVSNYKRYPSGHHYFTLKDAQGALSCVMFRSSAASLRFNPENGMQVLAVGRVTYYPRDGKVQFYVNAMAPAGTGALQIAYEKLKAKLSEEGLFDNVHKKALPPMPEKIALITSSAGAAVHDMIRILSRRWPAAHVIVVPVRVQGVEAPEEIRSAIALVNSLHLADLIITGRGGGSIEDLSVFNDELVARAIFASEIPVISAVGHEPDVTISDYVADVRASTPSNAAELAVPDKAEVAAALNTYQIRITRAVQKKLEVARKQLMELSEKRVLAEPAEFFSLRRMDLDMLRERLAGSQARILAENKQRLAASSAALDAMSPLKVLSRGYVIPYNGEGRPVSSASLIKIGDQLQLRFADGTAGVAVNKVAMIGEDP